MIGIYKITSPTNKLYIGQSLNIEKRFNQYKKIRCKCQVALYRSLLKYGVENHEFEVIEECSIELLNERERYWQDYFKVLVFGLNCKLTKTNDKSGKLSNSTKEKIKQKAIGRKASDETKLKMSIVRKGKKPIMLGKKHSEETKLKISNSLTGKKRPFMNMEYKKTIEWKDKMSKALRGKNRTKETKEKMSKSLIGNKRNLNNKMSDKHKEILKMSFCKIILNVETGVFYYGTKEASFYNDINQSTLKNRLNGNLKNNTNLIYC